MFIEAPGRSGSTVPRHADAHRFFGPPKAAGHRMTNLFNFVILRRETKSTGNDMADFLRRRICHLMVAGKGEGCTSRRPAVLDQPSRAMRTRTDSSARQKQRATE